MVFRRIEPVVTRRQGLPSPVEASRLEKGLDAERVWKVISVAVSESRRG